MDEFKRFRTEITIETVSVTTIRSQGRRSAYCKICGDSFALINDLEAMSIGGENIELIEDMCREGKLHRISDSEICGNSLAIHFAKNEKLQGSQ